MDCHACFSIAAPPKTIPDTDVPNKAAAAAQYKGTIVTAIAWTLPGILSCLILTGILGESFIVTGTEGRTEWDVRGRRPGVRSGKGEVPA